MYKCQPAPKFTQTRRSLVHLPQELVDNVISEIRDDRPTLHTLSLVSNACKDQSRKYLFNELVFSTAAPSTAGISRDREQRFMDFTSILDNDPKIAAHARNVYVMDSQSTSRHTNHGWSWIITNGTFHQTLQRIAETGTIVQFMFDGMHQWEALPHALAHALLTVFKGPCLKHLRLVHLARLPMSACSTAVGVKMNELSLISISIVRDYDHQVHVPLPPENLEVLRLEYVDAESVTALLDAILPESYDGVRGTFPALAVLSVGPKTQDDVLALAEVVQAGRHSINYFAWEYKYGLSLAEPLDSRPIDLGPLQNLSSIHYDVTCTPEPQSTDPFAGLLSLLGTVNLGNIVRDLHIKVHIPDMLMAMGHLAQYHGWQRLDDVLASSKFKHVITLSIELDLRTILTGEEGRQSRGPVEYNAQFAQDRMGLLGSLLLGRMHKWLATGRDFEFGLCVGGRMVE